MVTNNRITEKELLARIAIGNEESFKILFNNYNERLFYYISTIVKSPQVAEEIVMDVFLKIWLGKEIIPQIEKFDSFLFRVAHNKSIDFLRSVAKDEQFKELLWKQMQFPGDEKADSCLIRKEFECKLREAISLLSVQRRKAYQLSREEDMNHEQIAQQLGLSKNTVNNHIVEAQRFIRSYLVKNLDIAYFLALFLGVSRDSF
jgi:RNA polymerase sigma-70 factor (ECF subfamily)